MPRGASGEAIANAVNRLLKEPPFRTRATKLAAAIAAMPGPDEVAPVLERLAATAAA